MISVGVKWLEFFCFLLGIEFRNIRMGGGVRRDEFGGFRR